ncbi:MAG: ISNCY family transposase [Candidatus Omnitrophica bacterium]|nr:ISNCY family transposase [Candidatus Omnitrophota bacterium]
MRKVMEMQLKIGQVDISKIEIDLQSRDEIPELLLGLKFIYQNRDIHSAVFEILKEIVPKEVDPKNGRPGMDLWKIFVLGTLRLICNWDYDKVHDSANNHKIIREFLGHSIFEFHQRYSLQAIKDNVCLMTPELLDRINQVVIRAGYKFLRKTDQDGISGRCDSFVVETDVHFPTDINLLLDAMRKVITLTAGEFEILGLTEWRQSQHHLEKIKKHFNYVQRLKRISSKDEEKKAQQGRLIVGAYVAYMELCEGYLQRVRQSIGIINDMGIGNVVNIMLIERFMGHAERQIDQIRRRIVAGEKIPHDEKVFSIFEEHTEWISKGKAGVPQELGLRVCVIEDQHGFILHHRVMEKETDDKIAVEIIREVKRRFPQFSGCSFDKGFHSPKNQEELIKLLDHVVLPRKGRLSEKAKEIEQSEEFVRARHKHAAVESAINALENHGLDRCLDHGIFGFKRYVALAVLARNIQILGKMIQEKELKRLKKAA